MIDQSLVRSGFDAEVLFGTRYIKYLLLNSVETGSLLLNMTIPIDDNGTTKELIIRLYVPEDYERIYEPNPLAEPPIGVTENTFDVGILFDDPANADLRIIMTADFIFDGDEFNAQEIELYTTFALETETDDNGNQKNAKMRIELVDLAGLIVDLGLAAAGISKEEALALIKPYFDRSIDLGLVGKDQNVQSVSMKKHEANSSHPKAIGLYLNLKLKDGPEENSFIGDRGDLDDAENFLPETDDIAFGMAGSIYPLISNDAFQRIAEETEEGSGDFEYPIHEDPSDKDSKIIGQIKGINTSSQSGNLIIDVHGDYAIEVLPDPDFHLYITLKPVIENGLISWEMEYDVDLNPFLEVASLFLLIVLSALFGPGGFVAGGIIAALVFGGQELIVEPLLSSAVAEKGDSMIDASFFDAIPNKLTIETKRWDPFYFTRHQIIGLTDALQITVNGIGFSGKAILDKEPEAVSHVAIRDEERNEYGEMQRLWYKVKDFGKSSNDFISEFPGTDRKQFEKIQDPEGETDLVALWIGDAESRITQFRLLAYVLYIAKKVYTVHSQIDGILAISQREINDLESGLKNTFRDAENERIKEEQGDELREEAEEELLIELGEEPTDEQIEERLNEKLNELSEEPLNEYIKDQLETDLRAAVNDALRFDLPPQDMAELQSRKILFLKNFVVIRRKGIPYYRDRKDLSKLDNLLSLPRYKPEG